MSTLQVGPAGGKAVWLLEIGDTAREALKFQRSFRILAFLEEWCGRDDSVDGLFRDAVAGHSHILLAGSNFLPGIRELKYVARYFSLEPSCQSFPVVASGGYSRAADNPSSTKWGSHSAQNFSWLL
jgi:hypothetical protein